MKVPGAEQYPVGSLLALLITIMILVGGDEALFGNVGKALERTVDFDLDSMATLQVFQGFTMALLGPLWATLCSRGTMNRQTILAILTFGQGLVTLVMAFNMTDMWTMRLLRCLNGACLSGMMPITFSIIADRFDDEVRGRMCALMNMARGLGAATSGMLYLEVAEYCTSEGRWSPCTYDDPCNESCSCGGLFGWQYSFIVYGVVAMAFAPLIFMLLKPPPITVKDSASGETELQKIRRLIGSTPTFAILVLQGCAGAMPWAVLYLRPFFFQTAEMSSRQTNIIVTTIQFLSIFGGGFSGWLSDTLARISERHGRIINAEFSVYGSVIISFLTFYPAFFPETPESAFYYFFTLSILMSLVAGGVQGGTNIPILSTLAEPADRALIIAWQASLEGCISSWGPILTIKLTNAFGYDKACENQCPATRPDDCGDNAAALGQALLYTFCVGWSICGVLYSSLHYFYPRDMKRLFEQRRLKLEAGGAGLSTELTSV